jgi:hypothetical protein
VLWEACEPWADSPLADPAASSEEAKRGLQADLQNEIAQEIEALFYAKLRGRFEDFWERRSP